MSKLTLLLLVLSLIGISKPAKSIDGIDTLMFALPFLGAIVHQTNRMEYDHDKEMAEFYHNIKNLNYVPIGGCKIFNKTDQNGATINGRACKQADGSWRMD